MFKSEILSSIEDVKNKFQSGQLVFLTESDLKIHLVAAISNKIPKNFTINTESPWYDTYETHATYFIDITAFDQNKLQITYDSTTKRKGYKYEEEALAIELKYFRHSDDIPKIADDFFKMSLLIKAPKNDCYIVAAARTPELYNTSKAFMYKQMENYREQYKKRVTLVLFGPNDCIEII